MNTLRVLFFSGTLLLSSSYAGHDVSAENQYFRLLNSEIILDNAHQESLMGIVNNNNLPLSTRLRACTLLINNKGTHQGLAQCLFSKLIIFHDAQWQKSGELTKEQKELIKETVAHYNKIVNNLINDKNLEPLSDFIPTMPNELAADFATALNNHAQEIIKYFSPQEFTVATYNKVDSNQASRFPYRGVAGFVAAGGAGAGLYYGATRTQAGLKAASYIAEKGATLAASPAGQKAAGVMSSVVGAFASGMNTLSSWKASARTWAFGNRVGHTPVEQVVDYKQEDTLLLAEITHTVSKETGNIIKRKNPFVEYYGFTKTTTPVMGTVQEEVVLPSRYDVLKQNVTACAEAVKQTYANNKKAVHIGAGIAAAAAVSYGAYKLYTWCTTPKATSPDQKTAQSSEAVTSK